MPADGDFRPAAKNDRLAGFDPPPVCRRHDTSENRTEEFGLMCESNFGEQALSSEVRGDRRQAHEAKEGGM